MKQYSATKTIFWSFSDNLTIVRWLEAHRHHFLLHTYIHNSCVACAVEGSDECWHFVPCLSVKILVAWNTLMISPVYNDKHNSNVTFSHRSSKHLSMSIKRSSSITDVGWKWLTTQRGKAISLHWLVKLMHCCRLLACMLFVYFFACLHSFTVTSTWSWLYCPQRALH